MKRIAVLLAVGAIAGIGLIAAPGAGANPPVVCPATEKCAEEPPTTTTTTTAPEEEIEVCRDGKNITIPKSELEEGDIIDDCPEVVVPPASSSTSVIVVPGPPVAVPAPPRFTG